MHKKSQMKFVFNFLVIFLISFALLYSLNLVPESIKSENGESWRTLWDKTQKSAIDKQLSQENRYIEYPTRIVIDKIKVDSLVANPNTTNVTTLDEYLKQGAVRYPGSGTLGVGNMFIFGHSTGLKVVNNQAYKTFNGLKDLVRGDIITVYSSAHIIQYMVRSVTLVDQNQALVDLSSAKNMLTLSTCNTFGEKSERYVVEADLVQ